MGGRQGDRGVLAEITIFFATEREDNPRDESMATWASRGVRPSAKRDSYKNRLSTESVRAFLVSIIFEQICIECSPSRRHSEAGSTRQRVNVLLAWERTRHEME